MDMTTAFIATIAAQLVENKPAQATRGRWEPSNRPLPSSCWAEIKDALWAAQGRRNQPMTHDDYQSMTAYYRLAYENALRGSASEETWGCLALGSNMALILAEKGIGAEWIEKIQEGQEALMRANARGEQIGSWRMDGMGAKVLGEVLDILDGQLEVATRGEIIEARDIILKRMADQVAELKES